MLSVGCTISTENAHKLPNNGGVLTADGRYISGKLTIILLYILTELTHIYGSVFIPFLIHNFAFSDSFPKIWHILSKYFSKLINGNGQELLREYSRCFYKLDAYIKNDDVKGVEKCYGKILYLKQVLEPLIFNEKFQFEKLDGMNLLLQDLLSTGKINLEYMNAYFKPCFNQWYAEMQ